MTLSDMAVVDGSPDQVPPRPSALTRARARAQSVTARDRLRALGGPRVARMFRVVYSDTADSWIAEERSPSAKTVWRTDYIGHLDKPWPPYRVWAKVWRPVAVFAALSLDGVKFFLIHPIRGPVTVLVAAALTASAVLS